TSQPALGAVVATDEALLALACADQAGSGEGPGSKPICRVEGGRLVLGFSRYETVVPGEPGGYDLDDLEVGTQYGSPAPSPHWYAYVKYDGTYYFTSSRLHNVSQSANHPVVVTDFGLDEARPNCVWIEWEQPFPPPDRRGKVEICLPPLDDGDGRVVYGFQPGSEYELDDLLTITNNSKARYGVTMAVEGSLDRGDLGVELSSGGTTFHPSGGQVVLDPGETIAVT